VRILDGCASPFEALKAYQQAVRVEGERKTRLLDLIVLSAQKDPYYIGTPTQIAQAEWFASDAVFGESTGVHLRRLHYRLVSRGDEAVRDDGSPYENDRNSWQYLNAASRYARYLGKVDPEDIVDKRNPTPHIYMPPGWGLEPDWTYELDTNRLDRISTSVGGWARERVSPPVKVDTDVGGYIYEQALQPYQVEVWAEKTTMDDILVPLCSSLGANYVSGAGYQSITSAVGLLRGRIQKLEKPTRILYVSDYDAAGQNMPKQMSRQIEFWSEFYGFEGAYDIRLEPVVLTAEQAAKYPEPPDGSGAIELDAMEAFDPGLLEQIAREGVSQFRDFNLSSRVRQSAVEAKGVVEEAVQEAIAEELEAVENLKAEAEEIYGRYRPRLEALAAEMDAEMEPLDERLETYQQAVREKLEALEPELPPIPEGETEDEPEDEGWLFDSRRDYPEQLDSYKER